MDSGGWRGRRRHGLDAIGGGIAGVVVGVDTDASRAKVWCVSLCFLSRSCSLLVGKWAYKNVTTTGWMGWMDGLSRADPPQPSCCLSYSRRKLSVLVPNFLYQVAVGSSRWECANRTLLDCGRSLNPAHGLRSIGGCKIQVRIVGTVSSWDEGSLERPKDTGLYC